MSEWKECRLGDVCRYVRDRRSVDGLTVENYISTENLIPNKGGYTKASSVPEGVQVTEFHVGDVLVSNIRPYFKKIWQATFDSGCSNDVLAFRSNEGVDPRWLYFVIANDKFFDHCMAGAKGCKMPRGDKQQILEYPVRLPDKPTQRKIAAVLGALDDKIELNRKMNATLEQMAQALFKSWFVDFEPFGVERKSVDGRQIPVEFELVQIGQLNPTLETGKRPKGGASTSGVPSVGAESVKHLGDFDYSATKFVPEEFAAKMVRGKINGYEVLLYKDGGKPGTFMPHFSMFGEEFPYADFYINEHVFKLDAGSRERNVFLLFNLQTDINVHWFESCGAKAAVPGINQSNVFDAWVFNPDQPKAKEFSAIVLPMVTKILKNCKQSRTLAQLRDTLLPKLMSGELDVDQVRID